MNMYSNRTFLCVCICFSLLLVANYSNAQNSAATNKPIKLQSFIAAIDVNKNVTLQWSVSQEFSHPTFKIEHKVDNSNWETIGSLESTQAIGVVESFLFYHKNPGAGVHQYRIKQVAATGGAAYSDIKTVEIKSDNQLTFWPNPATNVVYFKNIAGTASPEYIAIYDKSGKLVKQAPIPTGANSINASSLTPDIYVISLQLKDGQTINGKVIKQ